MASMPRAPRREYHAKQRHRRKYRERLQQEQTRAQRFLQGVEQALVAWGPPETLAVEVAWQLQAQAKPLGKIFGQMFPTMLGCRTPDELSRVRGWDKNLPSRLLGALPTRQWVRQLHHRGQDLLATLWPHVEDKSPATRSRWPWTWVGDASVFKKSGQQLGLVGTGDRGQEHRGRPEIDGLLLVVVIGDGQLVVPVDCVVRRPDPVGPGHPCRDQLTWRPVMLDRTWAALQRLGLRRPPPLGVANRWCGDSQVMAPVASHLPGLWLVEGKRTDVVHRRDGRRITGQDLLPWADWPWRDSPQVPGGRYVRRMATSATSGRVTRVMVDKPGQERFSVRCRETSISAPRLIRAWGRRRWIEPHGRPLKPRLATAACQVQTEAASYGPLVLRLLASLVLHYTARVLFKGRVTMEAIVFSLTHHWRFLNSAPLAMHDTHVHGTSAWRPRECYQEEHRGKVRILRWAPPSET